MNDVDSLYTDKDNFIVVLDSRNATQHGNGSFNSQMTFIFQDAIRVPSFAIIFLCSVLQFQSPNSLYNVNETNNTLIVTINAVKTTYTITKGNYNCNTFITAVLSILPSGFTMTMNSITNIYSLTYTSDFSISGTCGQLMGFYGYGTLSSISKALTMPFTCNFNGPNEPGALNEGFSDIQGKSIEFISANNIEAQATKIHALVLDLLQKESVNSSQFVVLIEGRESKSIYSALTSKQLPKPFTWRIPKGNPLDNQVVIETIYRFKGLEADIVILWGIDNLDKETDREIFYVAASRAKSRLFVVGTEVTCNYVKTFN
jgi:hypothetical protein